MNNLTLAPEVAIVAEIEEETEKERHITEYIRSLKTIEDAMDTLKTSDIEYMYLPEIGKLVKVPNE